jgi:multiple sugar transport system ATP-binding protein
MAFGMRLRSHSKKEIREQVLRTAALLQLDEVLTSKPGNLSGGQRQRVAIGRAIIRRPKVFLFDEPLSNLDAKLRTQMRIELQKLHREIDATMIYVTHDQTEAMTLGDRIAVLNKGRLMQLATPLELYNSPENKFVAGFIGSPAMNFVTGALENNGDEYFLRLHADAHIPLGNELTDSQKKYTGRTITAGVRPEHIAIGGSGNAAGIQGRVVAYENMGNEQIIYAAWGELNFILRRFQQSAIAIGSQQIFCFETGKIIYFDPESGGRV